MYQVGTFPNWDMWGEWNGKFRDDLRCVLELLKAAQLLCRSCRALPVASMPHQCVKNNTSPPFGWVEALLMHPDG